MRKIKFKIEYVPLSDDRIERHKDFDKLLSSYAAHPKPSWKSRLVGNKFLVYTGGIITGAALASLLWWNANNLNEQKISARENSPAYSGSKTENSLQESAPGNSESNHALQPADTVNLSDADFPSSNENLKPGKKNQNDGQERKENFTKEKPREQEVLAHKTQEDQEELKQKLSQANKQSASTSANNTSSAKTEVENSAEISSVVASAKNPSVPADKDSVPNAGDQQSEPSASGQAANLSPDKKLSVDTIEILSESPSAKINIPLSSLPPDSSKKGININLPKIDLNVPINAISDAADTAGKKIDSLFTKLFTKDSSREEKLQEEISSSDPPSDSSKKRIQVNLPKIDLNASIDAISSVADTMGKKIDSLFTKLFEKDSSKEEKPQEEIPSPTSPADTFTHRYAQVSFVSPLGTNGVNGKDYVHNFSFNILQGYTGALKGIEFGGLANVEKGYVHGIQFGGLTNFAFGNVKGAQFGGLVNYGKNLRGLQVSGLVSWVAGSAHGAQIGGIMNVAPDTLNGLQLGGVLNLSLANKPSGAWQIGGVSNISLGDLHGTQISGVLNVANKITGTQVGLLNVAKKVNGFQLGLINVADSLDGEAFGLISISTNGIHNVTVFGSEILYGNVALKIGSPHIYTIFAAGAAPLAETRIGFGVGVGGHFPVNRFFIDLDGISWTIHNSTLRDWDWLNLWNQVRLMAGYQFTSGFAIYGGPTANAHVYKNVYPAIANYTIYDHTGNTNVQGWIGFVVGVQFFR